MTNAKLELSVVQFDRDVKGPGNQQTCPNTSTYASKMKGVELLIEFAPDARIVSIFDASAKMRDTILVPVERVVRMELAPAKAKAKAA